LNLNHTSPGTSLAATLFLNLSQSSPGGTLSINCSSNVRSSLSSESSSLSYCPRNDIPGACAASFSLSLSLSFGCGFPRCDPERVETFSGAVEANDGVDTNGAFCWAWLDARKREEVRGPEGPGVDVDAAGDVGTFIASEEVLVLEGPAWGSSSSTMIRSSYMAMRRVDSS
ncbi:hypothetical protein HHX47_DHR1000608, partial [Lentinula edodes]